MTSDEPGPDAGTAGALERLLDDERARTAARGRAARRHEHELAAAEATLLGTLRDLAEARAEVVVRTVSGRTITSVLEQVGADFVTLRAGGRRVHVAAAALATVQPGPAQLHADASGARTDHRAVTLRDVAADLAAERSPVALVLLGRDAPLTGTLTSVGADVLTLAPEGTGRARCYVSLSAVLELEPADFGSG